jgi:hypothetical protein
MPKTRKKTTKSEFGVLVLDNFSKSSFVKREVSFDSDLLHRLVLSPSYLFKFADNPSFLDYGDKPYPLLSHLPSTTINLPSGSGYPTAYMTPSNVNDSRIIYIATSTGKVFALSQTGVARNFGQPATLTTLQNETTLAKFIGKIFFINPSQTSIYHIDETSTGTSWTSLSGFVSPKFGLTFSVYFYVADKSASTNPFRNLIKVYGTSLSQVGSLDIGQNKDIQDIVNNNNRFLVVIANDANVFTEQYMFLWDGSHQNRPFHIVRLPGIYSGSVVYGGAFFIFVRYGNSTYIYELAGYVLRLIDILPNIVINETFLPQYRITSYGNFIIFPAVIKDLNLNCLILYNVFEKETMALYASDLTNTIYGVWSILDLAKNFRVFYNSNEADKIYHRLVLPNEGMNSYETNQGVNSFQQIPVPSYYSNVINFFRRIMINRVDVFYGNKPTGTNKIDILLRTIDEYQGQTTFNEQTLTIDNQKMDNYHIFDAVGLIGNRLEIRVSITTDGSFRGGLKRVIIYYSPLI